MKVPLVWGRSQLLAINTALEWLPAIGWLKTHVTPVICLSFYLGILFSGRSSVGARREQRVELSLPVRIWGMDREGRVFEQDVTTLDITPVGACLTGVTCNLQVGTVIGVQHGNSKSRFRVAWIGEAGSPRDHQIGILTVEPGKYIWGVALARQLGDFFRSESASIPAAAPAVPRPAPHLTTSMSPSHRAIRFGSDHRSVKRHS